MYGCAPKTPIWTRLLCDRAPLWKALGIALRVAVAVFGAIGGGVRLSRRERSGQGHVERPDDCAPVKEEVDRAPRRRAVRPRPEAHREHPGRERYLFDPLAAHAYFPRMRR